MSPKTPWQKLLKFYGACLSQESSFSELLQRSGSGGRYVFPRFSAEQVICGVADELTLSSREIALAKAAREKGEALFYGWPTVLFHEPVRNSSGDPHQRRRKLAPLLLLELALPPLGQPFASTVVPSSDVPSLHPQVLSRMGYKEENVAQLLSDFPVEPHLGSPGAMGAYARDLCLQLGVEVISELDPANLVGMSEADIDGVGVHNVATLFRGRSAAYHQHLLRELSDLESRDPNGTAAGVLAADASELSEVLPEGSVTTPVSLSETQEAAIKKALSSRVTVVTGPPGTGKSQLVVGLLSTCWAAGKTALVASTNNQAVDVVAQRGAEVAEGLVIRTGNRECRDAAKKKLESLLSKRDPTPTETSVRALAERSRRTIEELRVAFQERTEQETQLAELAVTRDRLGDELGISTGRWRELGSDRQVHRGKRWARRLESTRWLKVWRYQRLSRRFGFPEDVSFLPIVAEALEAEAEWRGLHARLSEPDHPAHLERLLVEAEAHHSIAATELVQALVRGAVRQGEPQIRRFIQTGFDWRTKTGVEQVFPDVLPHLKAWASTSLSVAPNIPLKAGLFDLVIIDEASQCSIPSAVPLLYRAKQAVIIGDPKQLTHISGIRAQDEAVCAARIDLELKALSKAHLSYQQHSLYAAFHHRVKHVHFLDEHYRSDPQIISLSNELFYGGSLTILTSPANLTRYGENAVAWRDVRGRAVRPKSGSAFNQDEAMAVVEELCRIAESRPAGSTIGVVTPFSAQARLISRIAERRLSEDARVSMRLEVGTVHRFQGDERDVIVFSPVAAEGVAKSSISWLMGTPNLFNVAVSRARSYLLVVGDRTFCQQAGSLLAELAEYVSRLETDRTLAKAGGKGELDSMPEARLYEQLLKLGIDTKPKVNLLSYECDFVVDNGQVAINIECDGRHHLNEAGRKRRQDIARDRLIEAKGYKVLRVPAWRCLAEPQEVAREIHGEIEAHRKGPGSGD